MQNADLENQELGKKKNHENLWDEILDRGKAIKSLIEIDEGQMGGNGSLRIGIEMGHDYRITGRNGTTQLHKFIQILMHCDKKNIYTLYFYCFRKKSIEKIRKIFPALPDNFKLRFVRFPSFLAFSPTLKRFHEFFIYDVLIPSIVRRDLIDVFVSTYSSTPCFEQAKCVKLLHDLCDYMERDAYHYREEADVIKGLFLDEDLEDVDIVVTFSRKERDSLKEWASAKRKKVISLEADILEESASDNLYDEAELLKRHHICSPFMLLAGNAGKEQQAMAALMTFNECREKLDQLYQLILVTGNGFLQNDSNLDKFITENRSNILTVSVSSLDELLSVMAASRLMMYLGDTRDGLWLLLRAADMGIPTIASAWPPPLPILDDCFTWVQPGDQFGLSEKIMEVSTDAIIRERFGKACNKMVENIQWRRAAAEFVRVLCKCRVREQLV